MKDGKPTKRQSFSMHDLPESVLILGVHFDPKLHFDNHISIVMKKVERGLYQLMQLARCKYYRFNSFVIFKLWESVLRPKMEYALTTVSAATSFDLLERTQKRAMRISKTQSRLMFAHGSSKAMKPCTLSGLLIA